MIGSIIDEREINLYYFFGGKFINKPSTEKRVTNILNYNVQVLAQKDFPKASEQARDHTRVPLPMT